MVTELIQKYIWLIQILSAAGDRGLSLDEITTKYEKRFDQKYSRRSFYNHRSAISDLFGIEVECDRSTNRYWIPYGEVRKHFKGCMTQLRKRLNRENRTVPDENNTIEPLSVVFSVCKVSDYSGIDIDRPFVFTGRTDQEKSLVCPTDLVPDNTTDRDDGWRGFRIGAEMDFSLIGILARITKVLASNEVGIFAVSTYNTDYVLVKEKDFRKALGALKSSGYRILDPEPDTDRDKDKDGEG